MKFMLFLFVIYLLGAWSLGFGVSYAQERGIGVTPAKIEIPEGVEWPYAVPVEVFNLSSAKEQFEVTLEAPPIQRLSAGVEPGRFSLESGEKRKILVTFEDPRRETSGFVKIAAMGKEENFPTGTGIKIPFSIASEAKSSPFIASVASLRQNYRWFPWVLGTGMIAATLFLLWHFSDTVRVWILDSNKN